MDTAEWDGFWGLCFAVFVSAEVLKTPGPFSRNAIRPGVDELSKVFFFLK